MSPLAVLTAIILGSSVAIGFGLCTVWFLAFWLKSESKQLASEVTRLPLYCLLFVGLFCANNFNANVKDLDKFVKN